MKITSILLSFFIVLFLNCSSHSKDLKSTSATKTKQYINLINGYATECMMDRFFRYDNNWQRIKGEHGRNGIDGLYIKEKNGYITDLLVAESKFNHSRLGTIQKGKVKQMSKVWILKKLATLKRYREESIDYDRLIEMVQDDDYRARLFHLTPHTDNTLTIELYNIKSQESDVQKELTGRIDMELDNPKNSFEKDMIETFNNCRREGLKKWFDELDSDEIEKILYLGHL